MIISDQPTTAQTWEAEQLRTILAQHAAGDGEFETWTHTPRFMHGLLFARHIAWKLRREEGLDMTTQLPLTYITPAAEEKPFTPSLAA